MGVTTSTANAGATYVPIATYRVPSAQSSYTFTSIPQDYTDLVLVITAPNTTTLQNILLRFNSISTNVYSRTRLLGSGTAAISDRRTNDSYLYCGLSNTSQSTTIIQIMNYAYTSTYKTVLTQNNTTEYLSAEAGLMRNTSAISSILLQPEYNQFAAGSTFTIYGIKAA